MNKYLLYSSIIFGFMILLLICINYNPKYNILYLCVFLAIVTSILNHNSNSIEYKYIDRFIIILNIFVFLYFIIIIKNNIKKYQIAVLIFAILSYLLSKLEKNIILTNSLHSFSHFLSVILLYLLHI